MLCLLHKYIVKYVRCMQAASKSTSYSLHIFSKYNDLPLNIFVEKQNTFFAASLTQIQWLYSALGTYYIVTLFILPRAEPTPTQRKESPGDHSSTESGSFCKWQPQGSLRVTVSCSLNMIFLLIPPWPSPEPTLLDLELPQRYWPNNIPGLCQATG